MVWIAIAGILPLSASALNFQEPQAVAEPQRLAWTPIVDGKQGEFEWDSFTGEKGKETFFQWEPNRLYAAANLEEGKDLIISVDTKSNGWLVGRDNYEFRIRMEGGTPKIVSRILDGTEAAGPQWIDPSFSLRTTRVTATQTGSGWFVECGLDVTGMPSLRAAETKMGIRLDSVGSNESFEPFLPRTMTTAELVLDRGSSMPGGLKWSSLFDSRLVVPGDQMKIRYHFNGAEQLKLSRIDIDPSQTPEDRVARMSYPIPAFDKKGHTVVEFTTPVPANVEPGYRIVKAVLTDSAGNASFMRSSYRVAPIIECEIDSPNDLKADKIDRRFKFTYYVANHADVRQKGNINIQLPAGWRLDEGQNAEFVVFRNFNRQKRTFVAVIPANASGDFPVTLTASINGKEVSSTGWISIAP